jgi:hypothetical protein
VPKSVYLPKDLRRSFAVAQSYAQRLAFRQGQTEYGDLSPLALPQVRDLQLHVRLGQQTLTMCLLTMCLLMMVAEMSNRYPG